MTIYMNCSWGDQYLAKATTILCTLLLWSQRGCATTFFCQRWITNKTLMTELDYFPSSRDPVEILALECIKTQLQSNSIHLTGSSSPATFRMTSFSEYKESGKVWYTPLFYLPHGWLKPASFPAPNFHLALYTGCGKIGKGAGHTWQNSWFGVESLEESHS